MGEPPPIIELADVVVTGAELRSTVAMVEGVNWTVRVGEYWVVGGAPGSGKSDLLVTAAGLQRPGSGAHFLFGDELARLPEEEQLKRRLRVGMIFQGGGRLFSQLSVTENLALPVCYHGNVTLEEARPLVSAALEFTGLSGFARRPASSLTRNLHQRVALARALMLKPEVLLIDNPLIGLDPRQAFWWMEFLRKLAQGHPIVDGRPMTLVVAADDLRPWREQATHFAVVHEKRWIQVGGRADLDRSQAPEVKDLLASGFEI
jgi:ABC-type transporter Mla maintaining outer membrane lipid asymmetry ATPase subunit MlaF